MRERGATTRSRLAFAGVALASIAALGCTGSSSGDGPRGSDGPSRSSGTAAEATEDVATDDAATLSSSGIDLGLSGGAGHPETVAVLTGLVPADTRGVAAVDVGALADVADVTALLNGDGVDPAIGEWFGAFGRLAADLDVAGAVTSALVAHPIDPAAGPILLAGLRTETIDDVAAGAALTPDRTYGAADTALYLDGDGNQLALLPGGVLVIGPASSVEGVIDVVDGAAPGDEGAIAPFLAALERDSHLGFVHGLPALFEDDVVRDLSLRGAAVVSGALDVAGGEIGGQLAFHTSNASEFVAAFNALNLPSTQGAAPPEQPLTLADPVAHGLEQVVLTMPAGPLAPSHDEVATSRNVFKKLFAGMEALAYAEDVAARRELALVDLVVTSEADGDAPPSPGSVFIRWKFRDQAAIEAFERNELPAGFRLAPTRFLETDDPDGEYFLALNIYNAGGGSIVTGARAEWDVFVHPPAGADPGAGQRPRFFIVDALAEAVSADPANLVTPAEPLSHELVDGMVVSKVGRFDGDGEVPVFSSSFPAPDPDVAEVARFTREMAIGNDYIYWAHGVFDRVLYNATTFNHDAYFVDTSRLSFTDDSRWSQYLEPEAEDAVYYVNTLEYVASPMANLDSDFLDITPEWLAELVGFTTNGHQSGLMRAAVERFFRGEADPIVGERISNETPATYVNVEIADPAGLAGELGLPPGHTLAPTTLFEDGAEGHYLTLSVYEIDGAVEGARAEWSVYVDDGSGRPPHSMIIDLMTEEVAFDPYRIINLPSEVRHTFADGVVRTRLFSPGLTFDAEYTTAGTTREELSLDWIEAGDIVCSLNDVCDLHYYDAETLDVPVQLPGAVTVSELATPWDGFLAATPPVVFFRDHAQEYAVKPWYDLDVQVEELPFAGLGDRTHVINGGGELVGRTSEVADSQYAYTGDVVLDGEQVVFALDQEVVNALGVGHIFTTGSFDLATGTGTQTVVDCQGPALLCSDIENGSTTLYEAQDLDASDPDVISWRVDVVVDLGGSFGIADSASEFTASRLD